LLRKLTDKITHKSAVYHIVLVHKLFPIHFLAIKFRSAQTELHFFLKTCNKGDLWCEVRSWNVLKSRKEYDNLIMTMRIF